MTDDHSEGTLSKNNQTPLERIEQFSQELRDHYQHAEDCDLRIAAKLMLVALDHFQRYGGPQWASLAQEYVDIAVRNPAKFQRILRSNRGEKNFH